MATAKIRPEIKKHQIKQGHTNFAKSDLVGTDGVFPQGRSQKKWVLFAPALL